MDVDPLADTVPPRYAVESDDEDELNPLQTDATKSTPSPPLEIRIVGDLPQNQHLVIASGDAGQYWAKGASLGEQTGAIKVNDIQVGLAFNPSWTQSTIIVSETFTRLPISDQFSYAEALVNQLKPTTISILDIYPASVYISAEPIAFHNAPIRYLSTGAITSTLSSSAQPFATPNMVHSTTSAALLSLIASDPSKQGTLILLPFPRVSPPAPKTLQRSDFSHLSEDFDWSDTTMKTAHKLLFSASGEQPKSAWHSPSNTRKHHDRLSFASKATGEGGMYI